MLVPNVPTLHVLIFKILLIRGIRLLELEGTSRSIATVHWTHWITHASRCQ